MEAFAVARVQLSFASIGATPGGAERFATAFYTALGGRPVHSRTFTEGAWRGRDTAFAWDDLSRLLAALPGHAASAGDSPHRPG